MGPLEGQNGLGWLGPVFKVDNPSDNEHCVLKHGKNELKLKAAKTANYSACWGTYIEVQHHDSRKLPTLHIKKKKKHVFANQ